MGYEVAALQQQVDIVGCPTLHAVCGSYPSRIFGCTPIQLWRDFAAQFLDGAFDGFVSVAPIRARVWSLVLIVVVVISAREDATVIVGP
jgi:hypothetical protein